MKRTIKFSSAAAALAVVTIVLVALTVNGWGQFTQDKIFKIDVSGYPAEIQNDYKVYTTRCSTCHELGGVTPKLRAVPAQQEFWIRKMQAMPSVNVKDEDAKRILAFLSYDSSHHASESKGESAAVDPRSAASIAAGKQFYADQSCNACHTVGGEGGSGGPALDNVGRTLNREKLTERMKALRSGLDSAMPPLPSDISDEKLNALVDYLLTLKVKE